MKILLILTLLSLLTSPLASARSYECDVKDDSTSNINISVRGQRAEVVLQNSTRYEYNCLAERDDFGLLIDCTTTMLDFMILLNDEYQHSISGGVMSSTHNLFSDIEC